MRVWSGAYSGTERSMASGWRRLRVGWKWWICGGIGLLLLIGAGWALKAKVFIVQQIEVEELVAIQPRVVPLTLLQRQAEQLKGSSLLWLDTDRLARQWQTAYPSVQSWQITKKYPQQLVVGYIPRVAVCQLQTSKGTYLVDRNGLIFATGQSSTLPTLTAEVQPVVGQSLSVKGVALGLALVNGLRSATPKLQNVSLHDGQLEIHLASNPEILVGENQSAPQTLIEITALLAKFAVDNRYPQRVDMRFDRPVLTY